MKQKNTIHLDRNFSITLEGGGKMARDLADCAHQGDCEESVRGFIRNYGVTADAEDCRDFLKPFGAWDAEELADDEMNLVRAVWVVAGNLKDSGEAFFCE